MQISFESSGDFGKTENFLKALQKNNKILGILNRYGKQGVSALTNATPAESGATAAAWDFEVGKYGGAYMITFTNSHIENGAPIAIMLQYGHGTGTGGYVQGRDYINPAIKPIFDKIADEVWKAVTSA